MESTKKKKNETKRQDSKRTIHIRLQNDMVEQLEKKIEKDGFDSLSAFYRFITANYLKQDLRVTLTRKPIKLSKEREEEYRKIMEEEGSKEFTSVDEAIKELYEDSANAQLQKKAEEVFNQQSR